MHRLVYATKYCSVIVAGREAPLNVSIPIARNQGSCHDTTRHSAPATPSRFFSRRATFRLGLLPAAENPPGIFHGLIDGGTYWVYVSRDDEEEKQDRERMKKVSITHTCACCAMIPPTAAVVAPGSRTPVRPCTVALQQYLPRRAKR